MRTRRFFLLTVMASVMFGAVPLAVSGAESSDPIAAEIERWSAFVRDHPSSDETWSQIKSASEPVLARAQEALRDGQKLLALQRLAAARMYLAADVYVEQKPAARQDGAVFEAEWTRVGKVLGRDLEPLRPTEFESLRPAGVRALAEAAMPQVRVYYEASLEYGRNTMPQYGLLYLGVAQAQREFAEFCRTLSLPSNETRPPIRAIGPELDRLEDELLAAYRPPASIDKHGEFIAISSGLKEARELDAAGLRYGALLKYLQTVQRLALIQAKPPVPDPDALARRLRELESRLGRSGADDSIGRIFLEAAQADIAHPAAGGAPSAAAAIASDVLPRYFDALSPARPEPRRPEPQVTVTLVRWPYT